MQHYLDLRTAPKIRSIVQTKMVKVQMATLIQKEGSGEAAGALQQTVRALLLPLSASARLTCPPCSAGLVTMLEQERIEDLTRMYGKVAPRSNALRCRV